MKRYAFVGLILILLVILIISGIALIKQKRDQSTNEETTSQSGEMNAKEPIQSGIRPSKTIKRLLKQSGNPKEHHNEHLRIDYEKVSNNNYK